MNSKVIGKAHNDHDELRSALRIMIQNVSYVVVGCAQECRNNYRGHTSFEGHFIARWKQIMYGDNVEEVNLLVLRQPNIQNQIHLTCNNLY